MPPAVSSPHDENGCHNDPMKSVKVAPDDASFLPGMTTEPEDCETLAQGKKHGRGSNATYDSENDKQVMFVDPEAMKKKLRQNLVKEEYQVTSLYKTKGIWQKVARHAIFEQVTLSIISFNAIWIAVDTDTNHAEVFTQAAVHFQVVEYFLCVYFSLEWFIRFLSFEKFWMGFTDGWFAFDSLLVGSMVFETWVMTSIMLFASPDAASGGLENASLLRIARLLRLSRMARMARLFRAMPELLILVKGMVSATRSVFFTLCLLGILLYIFAIAFVQLMKDSASGDKYFASVPDAMHILLLEGTLMDNPGGIIRSLQAEKNGLIFMLIFYVFLLLAAFTVLNMLIGVLCEVVSLVAATENEKLTIGYVKQQLEKVVSSLKEKDKVAFEISKVEITKQDMSNILLKPLACDALTEVGVDVLGLVDNMDQIYQDYSTSETDVLKFDEFMQAVLNLRGTNHATVRDIVDLRKYMKNGWKSLEEAAGASGTESQVTESRPRTLTDHFRHGSTRNSQVGRLPSTLSNAAEASPEAPARYAPQASPEAPARYAPQGVPEPKAQQQPLSPESKPKQEKQLWDQRKDLIEAAAAVQYQVLTFLENFPEVATVPVPVPSGDSGGTADGSLDATRLQELHHHMCALHTAIGTGVSELRGVRPWIAPLPSGDYGPAELFLVAKFPGARRP